MVLTTAVEYLAPIFSRHTSAADYDILKIQQARDECSANPEFAEKVMRAFRLVNLDGFFSRIQIAFDEWHDALEASERKKVLRVFQGY